MTDPLTLSVAAGAALLGGFSRGLLGFGGALILAPALVYIVEPVLMVPLIMLIDLPANAGLIRGVWPHWDRRLVGFVVLGTLVGLPMGIYVLLAIDPALLAQVVFAVVVLAALLLLTGWRYRRQLNGWELLLAGWANGLTLGATSIATGMVPVMFGGEASMREARANMIVWMTCAGPLVLLVVVLMNGLDRALLLGAGLLAPVYVLGVFLGARSFHKVNEVLFRRVVLFALLVSGLVGLFA